MTLWLFYGFAAITILFSVSVVMLRSPVTSALSLVASFFGVSGIFVLLHAPFLGVIQILIYAGAIMVLFLYVMMLLNLQKLSLPITEDRIMRYAAFVLAPLLVVFLIAVVGVPDLPNGAELGPEFGSMNSIGVLLLGRYGVVFELISVLLLASMIGVVVLAARKKEVEK